MINGLSKLYIPLTSEVGDFDFLQYIEKPLIVIIDDSHGIGLLGTNGEGIISQLPKKENIEYIFTYSLSKAFSINGGAISCSKKIANFIRTLPEYTSSTPLSPALDRKSTRLNSSHFFYSSFSSIGLCLCKWAKYL